MSPLFPFALDSSGSRFQFDKAFGRLEVTRTVAIAPFDLPTRPMGSLAVGRARLSARGLARAPKQLLQEARALLVPLAELREGSNPERTILTAAKGLNVLSQRDVGRAAMVSTAGLIEAMMWVVGVWLEEEILPRQSLFHRQQGMLASQERTGLAGRSRNSQSNWYSMELLDALCRLAKNEAACRQALAKLGCHRLLLRIMAAPAAAIGVRSACATGLRSLASHGPCREALLTDKAVQKLVGLIESLQSKIDSLHRNFEIEHTNLQLQVIEVLNCLLNTDGGREQVLHTGIRTLSKILSSSMQDIVKLAAAAGIALCMRGNASALHHLSCTAGPETPVLTADVLLEAAHHRQIKPTSVGALADVVKAIQSSSQGVFRTRCQCAECSMGDDVKAKDRDSTMAGAIAAMAAHFNITQRYLLVRGGLYSESDDAEESIDPMPGIAKEDGSFISQGPADRVSVTLPIHRVESGALFDAFFEKSPGHRTHFFASKNGSSVVKKRPLTGEAGRGRRHQTRAGEVLPPPWGPPPLKTDDKAVLEAEAMRQLVANPNLEKIASSMTFKSRGDRQAWQFLLGHVSTGANGDEWLAPHQMKAMTGMSSTPDIVMSLGSLGRDQHKRDADIRQKDSREDSKDKNRKGEIEDGRVESSASGSGAWRKSDEKGSEGRERVGLLQEHAIPLLETSQTLGVGDFLADTANLVTPAHQGGEGADHLPSCPMSPSARLSFQEGDSISEVCNCGLCPPVKAEIGPPLFTSSDHADADLRGERAGVRSLNLTQVTTVSVESGIPKNELIPTSEGGNSMRMLDAGEGGRSEAVQPTKQTSTAENGACFVMDGQWNRKDDNYSGLLNRDSIPAPLKSLVESWSSNTAYIQEEWTAPSPITSPPPPPAAGFPAPGQYSHSNDAMHDISQSQSMNKMDSQTAVTAHFLRDKDLTQPETLPTLQRAASSGLPSFSSKPSPRFIWSGVCLACLCNQFVPCQSLSTFLLTCSFGRFIRPAQKA